MHSSSLSADFNNPVVFTSVSTVSETVECNVMYVHVVKWISLSRHSVSIVYFEIKWNVM
jgi:hypothetical protein